MVLLSCSHVAIPPWCPTGERLGRSAAASGDRPGGLAASTRRVWGRLTLVVPGVAFAVAARLWMDDYRPRAWLIVMGCLALALVCIGMALQKQPAGVLIGERNMMSLSRLQL